MFKLSWRVIRLWFCCALLLGCIFKKCFTYLEETHHFCGKFTLPQPRKTEHWSGRPLSSGDINQLNQMYSCREHETVVNGRLCFYARNGSGLQDRDSGRLSGDSDPCIRVTAYNHNGYATTLLIITRVVQGSVNPEWNEWLNSGINTWIGFTVQVFDDDGELKWWYTVWSVDLPLHPEHIKYKRKDEL